MAEPTSSPQRRGRLVWTALTMAALAGCASTPSPAPQAPAPSATSAASSVSAGPTQAAIDEAALELDFARWVAAFRASAQAAGIEEATLRAAFDEVHYLSNVVERDRVQPEFVRTVWDYLDSSLTPQRVARGQDRLVTAREPADAAAARYGVPAPILVAIWGMESNFGDNVGNTPTIDALATLGFEGRREGWARAQLLAALKILQSGDIDRAHMIGSWAGAMGQTQFLPSSYLAYAVDADGDGRRDIWGSLADVMASTANFLARSGWRADLPWGAEVLLPPGFDPGRADAALRQPSAEWAGDGVRTVDGTPLPEFADGAVLLPAGARGPAFLVGPNFRAILRYNNSTSYALAVSLLAQRLSGSAGVQAPWPRDLPALTRADVLALQTALSERGFDSGTPDGMMGPDTRDALRRYQRSIGVPADGFPTLELLQRLREP
jgi:lytic murein transglycosylase